MIFLQIDIVCYLLSNRRNLPLLLCESIIFKSITVQNTTSLADSHWYTITGSGDVKHGFYFPAMLTLAIFSATSRHLYTCDVTVTKKSSRDRSVVKIFIEKVVKNAGGGGCLTAIQIPISIQNPLFRIYTRPLINK